MERFYAQYVEKFTNIDYLEHELDQYNLKDNQRRINQQKVIARLKQQHVQNQKDEIFEDEGDDANDSKFNEMRETKTGFGAKMGGDNYRQEGRLDATDDVEDSDGEEDDGDDGDIGDDGEDDDEDDASDHNF